MRLHSRLHVIRGFPARLYAWKWNPQVAQSQPGLPPVQVALSGPDIALRMLKTGFSSGISLACTSTCRAQASASSPSGLFVEPEDLIVRLRGVCVVAVLVPGAQFVLRLVVQARPLPRPRRPLEDEQVHGVTTVLPGAVAEQELLGAERDAEFPESCGVEKRFVDETASTLQYGQFSSVACGYFSGRCPAYGLYGVP